MEWPRTFYLHFCLRCREMYYGEEIDKLAACPICDQIDQVRCQAIERYLEQKGRQSMKKKGFTIIELLTVIAIITILLGLMIPGMRKVKRIALDLTQRSQFHSIDIGLEMWAFEHDDEYPESNVEYGVSYESLGAHKLAEALVGRDLHGFDSLSTWNADDDNLAVAPAKPYDSVDYSNRHNLYLNVDRINAFQIAQVYEFTVVGSGPYPGDVDRVGASTGLMPAPILTDVYKRVKITTPDNRNIKIGSPILYFKAKITDTFISTAVNTSTYNYGDNWLIFNLGRSDDAESHPYDWVDPAGGTGNPEFYNDLVNPSIPSGVYPVPYCKNSFVLLSAGADGLYGTADDVWNIKNKK